MFGNKTGARLDNIERLLRWELEEKDRRIQSLRRELESARTWARRWRKKAKHLRAVRRELQEKLKLHETSGT